MATSTKTNPFGFREDTVTTTDHRRPVSPDVLIERNSRTSLYFHDFSLCPSSVTVGAAFTCMTCFASNAKVCQNSIPMKLSFSPLTCRFRRSPVPSELHDTFSRIHLFPDPVYQTHAQLRLSEVLAHLRDLADGRLTFSSTETWRTAYEDLLNTVSTKRYLSVAVLNSEDYWQDQPGKRSIELNFQLLEHGFYVARIFILDDFFWPRMAAVPDTTMFEWISEQYYRGIDVYLLRSSELKDEPGLQTDFGVYGHAAVGYQSTDLQGRTTEFELRFDPDSMMRAEEAWKKLMLFAIPFEQIADVKVALPE